MYLKGGILGSYQPGGLSLVSLLAAARNKSSGASRLVTTNTYLSASKVSAEATVSSDLYRTLDIDITYLQHTSSSISRKLPIERLYYSVLR